MCKITNFTLKIPFFSSEITTNYATIQAVDLQRLGTWNSERGTYQRCPCDPPRRTGHSSQRRLC